MNYVAYISQLQAGTCTRGGRVHLFDR